MNHRQKIKQLKRKNKDFSWKQDVMRAIINKDPNMEMLYREIVFPNEHTKVIGKVEELTVSKMVRLDMGCEDNTRIMEHYKGNLIYDLMEQVREFVEVQEVKMGEEYPRYEWFKITASVNVCRKYNRTVVDMISERMKENE